MADLSCVPKFLKRDTILSWVGKNLKLMLLDSDHVPNAGTQEYVSDVVENEVVDVAAIYPAGGITLSGKAAVADPNAPNNYGLDFNDIIIGPGSTIRYRYGIIYEDMETGNHSVNKIYAQLDFQDDQEIVNGFSNILWQTVGVIYLT